MRFPRVLGFLLVALVLTPLAHADTTTIRFNGVNGANDGTYYVSPYTGTINYGTANAQAVVLFCVDINNEVNFGQVWNANITPLSSSDFSNTRYGNGSVNPNLGGTNPQTLYEEAAWLVTQFGSHHGDYVSLQYALWDLMTPGSEPTSYSNADGITVANWLAMAAANYGQVNPNYFEILTNVGPLAYTGQVQEFITPVATPEPASLLLLLIGVCVLALFLAGRRPHQPA